MRSSTSRFSRRRWLCSSTAAVGAVLSCNLNRVCEALAADDARAAIASLNRLPRMVHEYFVRAVREMEGRSLQSQANLKTRQDALAYVASVRARIAACFGQLPERSPLNPRVTGVVEREAYRIEKVIFESRPRFFVTANLYVPKQATFPAPGVVGVCGHSANGKAFEVYQAFCQGLAGKGYVVLVFDPIGQGERLQLPDEQFKLRVSAGVGEHLMVGNQQFLVGEFFGAWRAWDGIRALDYLLSRKEVDPRRVGVTGNSGGGTMTTWLCGLERRWSMAAPSCFVTTFRHNLENELPADVEQCPPRALAGGLDHADFLAALAPKPIVLLSQERDYFDVRGTIESLARLKRLYALLGASSDDIQIHVGQGGHGYSKDAREAMYALFNRAAGNGRSANEPPLTAEDDKTLWCTKSGQVSELDSRPVPSFTRETAERLASSRGRPQGGGLQQAVRDVLHLRERKARGEYRILRPRRTPRYPLPFTSDYLLETEPGLSVLVYRQADVSHASRPPKQTGPALLYVAHDSSDVELQSEPVIREALSQDPGPTLYACDVRGLGESRPNTCGEKSYDSAYGCDYFYAVHALMLDQPYVGGRTYDLLCVLDWIQDIGHREVHVVARGYGAIPAAYAALLHEAVAHVTLKNALTSYHDVAVSDLYAWPLSSLTPGVLSRFDLPDVYRELASKNLRLVEPWNADRKPAAG